MLIKSDRYRPRNVRAFDKGLHVEYELIIIITGLLLFTVQTYDYLNDEHDELRALLIMNDD